MLRCCEAAARSVTGRFAGAVTTPDSRAPIAPYLERRSLQAKRLSSRQSRYDARPDPG